MTEEYRDKRGGEILKETRETHGLSLETVHEMTKIPMDVLKAIEEGYTVRTLSPFYLRGFMKMYAQYLEVDPRKVLNDIPTEAAEEPKPVFKKKDIEVTEQVTRVLTKQRQQQIVKAVGVILALFLVSRLIGCMRGCSTEPGDQIVKEQSEKKVSLPQEKKTKDGESKQQAKKSGAKPKPTTMPVTPKPTPQPQAAKPPAEIKKVNLTVKANKQGWLQVKVDGNLVFQSVFSRGSTETWQADKEIEISGKVIHNLEYEVNGKLLGGLGRADRSARRVVITQDGLTVKR